MSGSAVPPPVLVTCLRCGREVSRWVVVLWQQERDRDGDVEVIQADALAILCLLCADRVRDIVRVVIDRVTS